MPEYRTQHLGLGRVRRQPSVYAYFRRRLPHLPYQPPRGSRNIHDRLTPFCLFTDPEIARVGLNENEAVAAGPSYRAAKLPVEAVLRARTLWETRGFMKAIVSDDSDEIRTYRIGK
jgi:hypothetical protein